MISAHSEKPQGMREWLDAQLSAARHWLALGAGIGAAGTWASIPVLLVGPYYSSIDIWLHIGSGCVLTVAVGWLLLTRGSVLRFSIVLMVLESILMTLRMSAGFLTTDPSQGISEVLPPLSPWVPLIFVVGFMLLPVREALYFCCAHMFVLMLAALVFITQAPSLVGNSYDMLNIALQYLGMHPLLVLLLFLIFQIMNQQRESLEAAYAREVNLVRQLERDDRQDSLSRAGILKLLEQALGQLQVGEGAVLIECRLEGYGRLSASVPDESTESAVRQLQSSLDQALDGEHHIGRMDSDRILLVARLPSCTEPELEALRARLEGQVREAQPALAPRVTVLRLEPGMTVGIAMKTLELATLQPQLRKP